jgi:hypothetical protein
MYIKNREPFRRPKHWEIKKIREFWAKASPQQQKVADSFGRDYWLVEASRHNNRRDWFLYFERSVHLHSENDDPVRADTQRLTIQINPAGKIRHYRRNAQVKDF